MANKSISFAPHITSNQTTTSIMRDVIIALLPASVAGVAIFGARALIVIAVCIASAVLSEFVFNRILNREQTLTDLSAVVTGLLLALNLPANIPVWQAVIGSVFAIIIVKCFFGGLGNNIVNPAITARVFMLISFTNAATAAFPTGVDATSSATPLNLLEQGSQPDLLTLFLGNYGGAIGETSTLALILGGAYLIAKKVITWHIPIAYIGTAFVLSYFVFDANVAVALSAILSGGLFIGAIFMATDYVTSPSTTMGKIVFGIIAGVLTVVIRTWSNYPEGVSFAILLANILCPYIESLTKRKIFGGDK